MMMRRIINVHCDVLGVQRCWRLALCVCVCTFGGSPSILLFVHGNSLLSVHAPDALCVHAIAFLSSTVPAPHTGRGANGQRLQKGAAEDEKNSRKNCNCTTTYKYHSCAQSTRHLHRTPTTLRFLRLRHMHLHRLSMLLRSASANRLVARMHTHRSVVRHIGRRSTGSTLTRCAHRRGITNGGTGWARR